MSIQASESGALHTCLEDLFTRMDGALSERKQEMTQQEVGIVRFVGQGIVKVGGLPNVRADEIVRFPGNLQGLVFNIDPDEIGVIFLDPSEELSAGAEVQRTNRVLDVPVGEGLLGRVITPWANHWTIRAMCALSGVCRWKGKRPQSCTGIPLQFLCKQASKL
jgi:F-type H+-transporting ATPase subunit alpha